MLDFPQSTQVYRRIPKEAFYQHLPLTAALKRKFVSDVERIVVENSLTKENLHLAEDAEVKEILFLSITLKKQNFEGKIVEAIARQNPHKLVFLLCYGGLRQLAVYQHKLYRSAWQKEGEMSVSLAGDTLTAIWENLIQQIAIHSNAVLQRTEQSIEKKLAQQDALDRLNKLIEKTEAAAWKEKQPKKRFAIYTKLQAYKKKREELTHG